MEKLKVSLGTIALISELNELKEMFAQGCMPFSKYKGGDFSGILYADKYPEECGAADERYYRYEIVCDKVVDCTHHDIVSVYGCEYEGAETRLCIDKDGNKWIEVYIHDEDTGDGLTICIDEDGWRADNWDLIY